MSIGEYSVLFYVIVTNSLVLLWFLINYMSIKKCPISSLIDLAIFTSIAAVTPFLIVLLMAYTEFHAMIVEEWQSIVAAYIVSICCGWLFVIYKKIVTAKKKHTFVMPK